MNPSQEMPRKTHVSLYHALNAVLMATGLGVAVYALAVPDEPKDKKEETPAAKKARLQQYSPAEPGGRTLWVGDATDSGPTITYKTVQRNDHVQRIAKEPTRH